MSPKYTIYCKEKLLYLTYKDKIKKYTFKWQYTALNYDTYYKGYMLDLIIIRNKTQRIEITDKYVLYYVNVNSTKHVLPLIFAL